VEAQPARFQIHGQTGDSPAPAYRPYMGARGGLGDDMPDLTNPEAMAGFMAAMRMMTGKGHGKGEAPAQYAKPTEPPKFDGFQPPVEEWERKLIAWETAYPSLRNRGALLVQSLSKEPFRLVTTTLKPEDWTREAQYDE